MTPAIVIFRDRVSYAQQCVAALDRAGLDVHIVDHGSTWPAALDWLTTVAAPVHWRDTNHHPRSLWDWDGLARIVGTGRYVVTDPDVVPDQSCPDDWPDHLADVLDRYPERVKAGLGLRVDDLPDHYRHAARVRAWEAHYWTRALADAAVFDAPVDTTLALYRPLSEQSFFTLVPAVRTGPPHVARHLPWYEDAANLSAELRHYLDHALPGVSHWAAPEVYA